MKRNLSYKPTGHKGEWLTALGIAAMAVAVVAIVVASGGTAAPLIAAGIVAFAGAGTTTFGVFDMVETKTGNNALKEKVFKNNEEIYTKTENTFATFSSLWLQKKVLIFSLKRGHFWEIKEKTYVKNKSKSKIIFSKFR